MQQDRRLGWPLLVACLECDNDSVVDDPYPLGVPLRVQREYERRHAAMIEKFEREAAARVLKVDYGCTTSADERGIRKLTQPKPRHALHEAVMVACEEQGVRYDVNNDVWRSVPPRAHRSELAPIVLRALAKRYGCE